MTITKTAGKRDIYSALLTDLASGDILPGQRLGEETLAVRWKVSRWPVRDALIRLESEGIVERRPSSGTYVREVSAKELDELHELRAAVEGLVIQKVVKIATENELDELESLARAADEQYRGRDVEKIIDHEMRFHLRLSEIADMRHAMRVINIQYLLAYCFRMIVKANITEPIGCYHIEIVNALRTRDAARCDSLLKQHFGVSESL